MSSTPVRFGVMLWCGTLVFVFGGAEMNLPTTPSFRLDGRRALVTGAWRGIGLAVAAALAEAGAEVVRVARAGDEIERVAAALIAGSAPMVDGGWTAA